ncbi:flagellar FLiS export co-chaperone [Helicobacter sp. 11S02596-1]|uniref:flagellar FLiS export co-chaperone n=1 Tax=Helicobacter sp. 11S02596-1 TaxID=1476194 RepID=UPI000BA54D41|nr:flagellar FLiS export co-chaperone [Helicobacter sp. 11S02596-1]PAF44518.1 hypothetical protein BJI48_03085 [Helicobacter sp. 11S02596-1]
MLEKDMLATFKKHLGGMDSPQPQDIQTQGITESPFGKSKKIKKFGEDIKSANEFIGAAQILDIACAKLIAQSQRMLGDNEINGADLEPLERIVSSEMHQIIEKCSFMGTELFDATLSVMVDSKNIEIEVSNPLPLVQNAGYEGVIAYLEDKRADLKNALALVSTKIFDQKIFGSQTIENPAYESFNAKDFLKMF